MVREAAPVKNKAVQDKSMKETLDRSHGANKREADTITTSETVEENLDTVEENLSDKIEEEKISLIEEIEEASIS